MATKRWTIHARTRSPHSPKPYGREDQLDYSLKKLAGHNSDATPVTDNRISTDLKSSPAIYHCVNRVVDKRFIFGSREKDRFVELMRMYEIFTGNRILAYCVMSNHFHLMIEITPMPKDGLSDDELLNRLAGIYDEAVVESVEMELKEAREAIATGRNAESHVARIHGRYTYRMHDLSEFMKSLVQRFTQWHNRRNERKGNLWEDAFKSTVVEPGIATRMVATYIDLNPVRAGIVDDPANYPWCSYGEAVFFSNSGKKQSPANHKAQIGLVRAFFAHQDIEPDVKHWNACHHIQREWIEQAIQKIQAFRSGNQISPKYENSPGGSLSGRIRHFTDGVAVGSRNFLDIFFEHHRDRFGKRRKTGPRLIRGNPLSMSRHEGICSLRDLQKNVS